MNDQLGLLETADDAAAAGPAPSAVSSGPGSGDHATGSEAQAGAAPELPWASWHDWFLALPTRPV